jgi:hypothetical protein
VVCAVGAVGDPGVRVAKGKSVLLFGVPHAASRIALTNSAAIFENRGIVSSWDRVVHHNKRQVLHQKGVKVHRAMNKANAST